MPEIPFFRLLAVPVNDKGEALREQVRALNGEGIADATRHNDLPGETFTVDPADFGQIPGSPFAYWVGESIRRLFETLPSSADNGVSAQHGASSKSDFRFLRLAWEVLPETIGKGRRWVNFAKGGQYSPYYADVHLLIHWENDAQEIKDYLTERYPYLKGETGWILHPESNYFAPGLTWSFRSQKGFNIRALPSNCIFAHVGPSVFVDENAEVLLLVVLGMMNSLIYEMLLNLQLVFRTL